MPLTGGTLTGALINSTNGAASTPVVSLTGTTFTGGTATTTKPTLIVEPTGTTSTGWSTAGTLIGANAATGFTGSLLDLQVAGSAVFQVTSTGAVRGSNYFNSTGIYGMQTSSGGLTTLDVNTTLVVRNANGYSEVFRASGTSLTVGTDLILGRSAPATFQLGVNAASTATAQTIKAHNVTTGVGANLILSGGTGSGGQNGVVIISRLPTSNPGPGILWNNAGTPAIGT